MPEKPNQENLRMIAENENMGDYIISIKEYDILQAKVREIDSHNKMIHSRMNECQQIFDFVADIVPFRAKKLEEVFTKFASLEKDNKRLEKENGILKKENEELSLTLDKTCANTENWPDAPKQNNNTE